MVKRLIKFLLGVALLPACWGATTAFYATFAQQDSFFKTQWPFLAGFAAYALIFSLFQQPIRTYVFGHELTHALWVWLFRGKVKGFAVSGEGGKVETTKSNFLIALAPYFFPVYSILILLAYLVARSFWPIQPYFKWLVFLLGFSWAFHVAMNLYALFKDQEEVRETGLTFSLALIYFLNLLILGALLVFTSPQLRLETFMTTVAKKIELQYRQLLTVALQ